ncbi:hypothetical protein BDR26DRAFT_854830 [Obelidium mucronatum]|nr:hypothetical protein BDR26DRAFT_854830 [Obelidium mucronatum]
MLFSIPGSSIDNPSSAVTDATFQQGFAQSKQSAKAAEASKQLETMTQTGERLTAELDDLATAFAKLTADFDISRKQVHDLKLRNDELEDQAKKSTSIWEHEKAELEAELTALQNSKGLEIESLENQTKELSSALAVVTAKRDSLLEKQLEAVRTTADIEVDTQFVPVPPVVLGVPPDAIHPILTLDDKVSMIQYVEGLHPTLTMIHFIRRMHPRHIEKSVSQSLV